MDIYRIENKHITFKIEIDSERNNCPVFDYSSNQIEVLGTVNLTWNIIKNN